MCLVDDQHSVKTGSITRSNAAGCHFCQNLPMTTDFCALAREQRLAPLFGRMLTWPWLLSGITGVLRCVSFGKPVHQNVPTCVGTHTILCQPYPLTLPTLRLDSSIHTHYNMYTDE